MCSQPLPPPLSPSSAKLMIMALEEYGHQSRRGIQVPRNGDLLIPVTFELMIDDDDDDNLFGLYFVELLEF
ncbi:hypothetical protein Tco_1454927 [Tanacetum coccineum]